MKSNAELLARVARALAPLKYKSVYVGGATTHLLITDVSAPGVTPTDDVDLVVDLDSPVEFAVHLGEELRRLGLREDTSDGAPLCRWKIDDTTVDVMSPNEAILGFTNRWYPTAIARSETRVIGDIKIQVIDAVTFLATKMDAFSNRGKGDFIASKDIEDIIAVLDGRPELVAEVEGHAAELLSLLARTLTAWRSNDDFAYAVEGYLLGDTGRIPLLFARIDNLIVACQKGSDPAAP